MPSKIMQDDDLLRDDPTALPSKKDGVHVEAEPKIVSMSPVQALFTARCLPASELIHALI